MTSHPGPELRKCFRPGEVGIIALRLGMTTPMMSEFLLGHSYFDARTLEMLCEILGADPNVAVAAQFTCRVEREKSRVKNMAAFRIKNRLTCCRDCGNPLEPNPKRYSSMCKPCRQTQRKARYSKDIFNQRAKAREAYHAKEPQT